MTDPRQRLPAVHQLLTEAEEAGLLHGVPRSLAVHLIRDLVADARGETGTAPAEGWLTALETRIQTATTPTLRPVVNATGVVLHTNLGRAPLAPAAVRAMTLIAGYSSLEYDLDAGERGSRRTHVRDILIELTGAEDALVVTNAAAALILILNTVAASGETMVSRGELVEIGGAFRIPDILRKSGTSLVEVGTTNRTRIRDYEAALSPRSKCVLKVHRSNFVISGFTSEVPLEELANLCVLHQLALVHDVGSGLLIDLERYGLTGEPLVAPSARTGATVIFSGDKLVGGPQAGIIVGPAHVIQRAAANPFARAMRPDKLILAALEATLNLYRDPERAIQEIPVLAMLTASEQDLRAKAERLASEINSSQVESGMSSPGGGSFPNSELPTTLVSVACEHPDRVLQGLRHGDPPVIARADEGRVLFDVRTILDGQLEGLSGAVNHAIHNAPSSHRG